MVSYEVQGRQLCEAFDSLSDVQILGLHAMGSGVAERGPQ